MKIVMIIVVVFLFGYLGMLYKKKLQKTEMVLVEVENFIRFLNANITLFKTNIIEIIIMYNNMHKNKNANNIQIIKNKDNTIVFNEDIFIQTVSNKYSLKIIKDFFDNLGKCEYEFEIEKIKTFEDFLKGEISKARENVSLKGDLYFKISLAIGLVVGVLLW